MITIINQGQKLENIRYRAQCPKCGCSFTYQEEDTDFVNAYGQTNIGCPNCKKALPHSLSNALKLPLFPNVQPSTPATEDDKG